MASYRADIEIGVKGLRQLQAVKKEIELLSTGVDSVNARLKGAAQSINAYDANLAKTRATLNKVNAGTIAERDAVRQYVRALGEANAARDRQNKLIQEQINLQRKAIATTDAGFGVQGPALPPQLKKRAGAARRSNFGEAVSSGIIGGGFPLLFGQGPAAAAGGALGGVAGGLLGGGFGFALSIAGTAIGDAIEQADKLNVTLAGLNATLGSTGSASVTTANDVSQLAKNLQVTKDEAIDLVAAFKQFNSGDVREALARGFGAVGGAQTFEAIAKAGLGEKEALEAVFSLRKQIGNQAAEQLALQLKSVGAVETQAALLKIVAERNIEILVAQSKTVQFTDRLLSTWENIVAAVASTVSLAAQFIAKMQEGSLIKLPFLDRIQEVLSKFVPRTPEQIAGQRGTELEKQLRKDLDVVRKALREETRVQGVQASLSNAQRAGTKPPEDRTASLRADLQALIEIGNAEDLIRDLRFQGRDLLVVDVELTKVLADVERDRVKQLERANYETERSTINEIARTRAINAQREAADKIRQINSQRFQEELEVQAAVRNAIKPFTDLTQQQQLQTQYAKTYFRLVTEGMLPAEAERIANFEQLVLQQEAALTEQLQITEAALIEAKARGASTVELEKQLNVLKQQQTGVINQAARGPGEGPTREERALAAVAQLRGELNQLTDPINMAVAGASAIGASFQQAFQGLITGTMTAKESLASFFKSVGESFTAMAAEIIAKQLTMYALQTVLKGLGLFGGSGFSFGGAGPVSGASVFGAGQAGFNPSAFTGGFSLMAEGGFVTKPTRAVVGEGGEPEYVIPASKMRTAMARYSGGARGDAVIPGSNAEPAAGGGGAAVAAPIDVRYTVERINSVDYVTADQFREGMRQAAAQGARQGEQNTLRRLQNAPSARRRIGI